MQIWPHKHIHTLANFSIKDYESVFELANRFDALKNAGTKKIPALQGTLVTSLFFEPSTRTKNSFELAAKRLSADVQTFAPSSSSLTKGETIIDTAITYSAMGADTLVIRHSSSYITFEIAEKLDAINSKTSVLNAGDGRREHPTQALLDALTIITRKKKIQGLKIAICGDILHSRVARSNIYLLSMLGAEVNIIAPTNLMPKEIEKFGVNTFTDMKKGLKDCDIVMMLRLQNERMTSSYLSSNREYYEYYGLTPDKLEHAKSDALIMHPGPMNRGIEIDTMLADDINKSVIKEQVELGVAVRMACLKIFCT